MSQQYHESIFLYGAAFSPTSGSPTPSTPSSTWSQASPIPESDAGMARVLNHDCRFNIATCAGCRRLPNANPSLPESSETTAYDYASPFVETIPGERDPDNNINSTDLGTQHIRPSNRFFDRTRLKDEFFKVYFPAGSMDDDADFMYSHFVPRELFQESGPAMEAAADALCLAQLAISRSDSSLIDKARIRQEQAIAALNSDLTHFAAMYDDHVLGALYLLGICEKFQSLSPDGTYARKYHTRLGEMLIARGPDDSYSKFAQVVIYSFRQLATLRGLVWRKGTEFADPAWKACSALTTGIMAELGDHLINVPAGMEKADEVASSPQQSSSKILSVAIELASLERNLRSWIVKYYSTFESLPFWPENVDKFPTFKKHTEGTSTMFQKALVFPSFSHASAQVSYWIALLQIKQALIMLNRLNSDPILPTSERILIAEATECADRLCESVAYLLHPRHGTCGFLRAEGPLYYASCWFAKRGTIQKVVWCDLLRRNLQSQCGFFPLLPDR